MTATSPRLVARSRWSVASRCARQASYGLLGVEPEEDRLRDDVQRLMHLNLEGLRRRGKRIGEARVDQYALQYGEQNIVREKEVEWPAGTLHEDVYVIPEALVVEVKSVTPQGIDRIYDASIVQCAGAVHFDPDAEKGLIEFVSPLDETLVTAVPVLLNDDLIAQVERIAHAVAQAGITQGRELPGRVCERPRDGVSMLCPYREHCFAGWQAEAAEEIEDAEVLALVRSLYEFKRDYRRFHAEAEQRKEGYKLVEARLADVMQPGLAYTVGPYSVRRIVSKGRESFALGKARKSGAWTHAHDEALGMFLSVADGSERWTVERDGEDTGDEFGEVPF